MARAPVNLSPSPCDQLFSPQGYPPFCVMLVILALLCRGYAPGSVGCPALVITAMVSEKPEGTDVLGAVKTRVSGVSLRDIPASSSCFTGPRHQGQDGRRTDC